MENSPDYEMKKQLQVKMQLQLKDSLDACATYLLQWAQQRKDSILLFCRKLKIQGSSKAIVIEIFKIVHADCIKDLELSCLCLDDWDFLNPYLKQMNNILSLTLSHITDIFSMDDSRNLEEENVITVIYQLPTLHHLQELYVEDVFFIDGNLKECLR